jgi:acetyl-CoA carboxylase, biotin carboxylase subunit
MFRKVLVINRGAVAARILRALRALELRSVAVYSEADRDAPYLALADETAAIGPAPPRESYLHQDRLLDVLVRTGADAVHPGYGFLSENPAFAERVTATDAIFIGPASRWLAAMGEKTSARDLMARHGMPVGAGSGILPPDPEYALERARAIGFPVMVKPAEGGGGIGMLVVRDERELRDAVERARSMAQRSFGSAQLYLEAYLAKPRHVEIQILADNHGTVMHLFERDCSVQRRHQKVIEEAPAPRLDRTKLSTLADKTVGILGRIGYNNIGTIETLLAQNGDFGFLEMNTRLQVEHAVTEEVTGVDIVASQIRLAAGERLHDVVAGPVALRGHAIEARVYAEDPKTFYPSPGPLTRFRPPEGRGLRVETGYAEGNVVTPFYDPLLAKVIAHDTTRKGALDRLRGAIAGFEIAGVKSNLAFIDRVLASAEFCAGEVHTGLAAALAR